MQHPIDVETPGSAPPAPLPSAPARVLPLRRGADPAPAERPSAPTGDDSAPPSASTQRSHAPRGWRPAAQCRWCRLGAVRPDLLDELHRAHVVQGLGARALVQVAGRRLGPGEHVPSARSMNRHIHHLDRGAYAMVSDDDEETRPGDDEVGWVPQELRELWRLYDRLNKQLCRLEGALSVTSVDGAVDLNKAAQVAGLSNSARGTLHAITKTRGSADAVTAALTYALNAALKRYSTVVVSTLEETINFAVARGATAVADRIRTAAAPRGPIVSAAMKAANEVLEDTLQTLRVERRAAPATPSAP